MEAKIKLIIIGAVAVFLFLSAITAGIAMLLAFDEPLFYALQVLDLLLWVSLAVVLIVAATQVKNKLLKIVLIAFALVVALIAILVSQARAPVICDPVHLPRNGGGPPICDPVHQPNQ